MTYTIRRATDAIEVNAIWDTPPWTEIAPLSLDGHMGEEPAHRPKVEAKLAYDDAAVYVIFRVEDHYVKATEREKYHDNVCRDSCVEFFFTPGTDIGLTYFNVEINCGGAMLLHYNPEGGAAQPLAAADCDRIQIAHSLPRVVDHEIAAPTTWTLEYRLPFDVIHAYCPDATKPAPGKQWRANLYKCADKTSHPHWLTWSPVDWPSPKFHVPECFGTLIFD